VRAVIQRVTRAAVRVEGRTIGEIGPGLLVLLGVAPSDTEAQADWIADRIANLRIFADDAGKMNRSVRDIHGGILVVSQFTLYGDASRGRRPSFINAARPEIAEPLYQRVLARLSLPDLPAQAGLFGADMAVELVNDGPVTLIIDS
jgi:D-tyrosyl-tRNA(Tyr) deacylase